MLHKSNSSTGLLYNKILIIFVAIILFQGVQLNLYAQDSLNVNAVFAADSSMGIISIKTKPEGAEVIIDSVVKGNTPLNISLHAGKYAVIFKKKGYSEKFDSVEIVRGKILSFSENLLKNPVTNIKSIPSDAKVYLDSVFIGRAPIDSLVIPVGRHMLQLKLKDYVNFSKLIDILPGLNKTINQKLIPKYGFFSISVSPKDTRVLFDSNSVNIGAINRLKVKSGWHNVEVFHPSFNDTLKDKFYIVPETSYHYKSEFNAYDWKPTALSLFVPGLGQILDKDYIKGSLEFIGFLGAGYYLNQSKNAYEDKTMDLKNAQINYDFATTQKEAIFQRAALAKANTDYKDAKNKLKVAYAIFGVVYIINILDAVILHSRKNELFLEKKSIIPLSQIKLYENGDNLNVGMQIKF